MHKGYAFVQFTNPFDARNACLGEDGRNILSQTLGELCVRQGGGGWTFFGWVPHNIKSVGLVGLLVPQ